MISNKLMMLAAAGAGGSDSYWYVKTSANNTGNGNIIPGGLDVDSSGNIYSVATVINDSRDVMILKKVQDGATPTITDRVTCHNHIPYSNSYADCQYGYKNCQLFDNETKLHIDGFGPGPYGYTEYKLYRYNTNLTQNNLFFDSNYNYYACGHSAFSNGQSSSSYSNRLYPVGAGSAPYYCNTTSSVRENGDVWLQGYDQYYSYIGALIKGSTRLTNIYNNHQAGCHQVGSSSFRHDSAGHCIVVDNDDDHVYWAGAVANSGPPNYYSAFPFVCSARWDSTNGIMTYNSNMQYPVTPGGTGLSGGNRYSGNTITISPVADANGDKWVFAAWLVNYSYYRGIYYLRLKITSSGKTVQSAFNEITGISTSDDKRVWDSVIDSQENYYIIFNVNDGQLVLWKYNSSGTYEWSRTFSYSGASGSNAYDFCDHCSGGADTGYFSTSLQVDSNDNIYIHTGTMTPSSGTQPFLIKYPSDGSLTGNFGDLSITSNGPYPSSNLSWSTVSGASLYTPNFGTSAYKNNTAASNFIGSSWGIRSGVYNTNSRASSNSSQIIS